MKLLIVDDEELTRLGLASALNWSSFGITELCSASDGAEGLATALREKPDIVLCDVRMPKMNGIEMLRKIEARLPDVSVVFMSGYSDKEYLKAAIELKAVHYIEKPISAKELAAAVKNAVAHRREALRHRTAEAIHSNVAASQLAFYLTVPYADCKSSVEALRSEFSQHYGSDKFRSVTTFVIRVERPHVDTADYLLIHKAIHGLLAPMHLHVIYTIQRAPYIVYHVYGISSPAGSTLLAIAERMKTLFALFGGCYAAVGGTEHGMENAFRSYNAAASAMQSSFFFEPGTVLTPELLRSKELIAQTRPLEKAGARYVAEAGPDASSLEEKASCYRHGVLEPNRNETAEALTLLNKTCLHAVNLTQNQVQALYYDLFSSLGACRVRQKLPVDSELENHERILEAMDACFSFSQLHQLLVRKTEAFFADLKSCVPENSTIFLIRQYIAEHYGDPALSVNEISRHVFLSVSYVCTFFKSENGSTLNQYITEYRMEKAKQLLADPRYKVSDVSASVGYSDVGYFGKSFRKCVGLTPSEYREKELK